MKTEWISMVSIVVYMRLVWIRMVLMEVWIRTVWMVRKWADGLNVVWIAWFG
jgi:hypothetical protein